MQVMTPCYKAKSGPPRLSVETSDNKDGLEQFENRLYASKVEYFNQNVMACPKFLEITISRGLDKRSLGSKEREKI